MIIQFCGLSGAGKTTLAEKAKASLTAKGIRTEVLDGDEYRKIVCRDLGFSKNDRQENIRRLAFIANKFSQQGIISIICAINPYEETRKEITALYNNVHTVFINCSLEELVKRDTKGLYRKAFLPDGHPEKLSNLSGVGDVFEKPVSPDLEIDTSRLNLDSSLIRLTDFISLKQSESSAGKIDTIKIRYNTESNGKKNIWRLLVNDKEVLVDAIDIRKPSVTSSDWLEEKQCMKHHITIKDCLLHIDEETNKAILS